MSPRDALKAALLPFAKVANSDPNAVLAAALAVQPDATAGEIVDAFEELAAELEQQAASARAELQRRAGAA